MRDKQVSHCQNSAKWTTATPYKSFCMCICGMRALEKQLQKQAAAQFGSMHTRMQQNEQVYSLLLTQGEGIINLAISW